MSNLHPDSDFPLFPTLNDVSYLEDCDEAQTEDLLKEVDKVEAHLRSLVMGSKGMGPETDLKVEGTHADRAEAMEVPGAGAAERGETVGEASRRVRLRAEKAREADPGPVATPKTSENAESRHPTGMGEDGGAGEDTDMAREIQALKEQLAAKTAEADEWRGKALKRGFLDAKTVTNGAPAKAGRPRKGGGGTSNEKCQK